MVRGRDRCTKVADMTTWQFFAQWDTYLLGLIIQHLARWCEDKSYKPLQPCMYLINPLT
jgi:hypothetical protein